MRRILFVASTLFAGPAIGQAPIDPPLASLPVPSVAVDSLAAAPSRAPARKPAPSIDDDVAEASPKVRAGSSSLNFEPNNLVFSLLRS